MTKKGQLDSRRTEQELGIRSVSVLETSRDQTPYEQLAVNPLTMEFNIS